VANAEPPDGLANQLIVPALAVADKFAVPLTHTVAPVTEFIVGIALTVAVTADRAAEGQPLFEASA
jgi:hypothetical protein